MSESSELGFARQDVEAAFRVLEFAIRTMCYFELGKVNIAIFSQPLTLLLKEKNAGFLDSYFASNDHAIIVSQMNVGAAFGASAIVLDNFFEVAKGPRNPLSNEPEDLIWCVVSAVRNAFAHGMASPRWVVKAAYRRKIRVDLEGTDLNVDLCETFAAEVRHVNNFAVELDANAVRHVTEGGTVAKVCSISERGSSPYLKILNR